MIVLITAWAVWAALHVAVWLVVSPIGPGVVMVDNPHRTAFTWGGAVYVTTGLVSALDPDELAAVIAHERGHIAHRHSLQRLALAILLPGVPCGWLARRHELEADAYAARCCGVAAVASALHKLPHTADSPSHPTLAARLAALALIA